ncbi:MAG: hypothetical protein HKN91_13580 [Acidimicrobiia bacterium]|nr:hypothetical protein [Acidimicrobiia bacterium]
MTDRIDGSDASSSEDLIRQAREAYVPAEDAPAPPARESSPATAAAPSASTAEPASEPAAITRPSDYVRAEYQTPDGVPASAPPSSAVTYEAQRPSFIQRFGGLLVGLAVVGGFIAFATFDRTTSVDDLAVGDCLRMPNSDEISSVESAPCAEDHELEVFATVVLSESSIAAYPGEDAVANAIFDLCLPRFQPYVGASYDTSAWYINTIFPTRESWEEADDREGTCVVYQPGINDEPVTLSGTARASNI